MKRDSVPDRHVARPAPGPKWKWWLVWSCEEHAAGLVGLRRTLHPIDDS